MRLATRGDGSRDRRLILLSPDGNHYADAPVETLQQAIEQWDAVQSALAAISDFPNAIDPATLGAPLPRAWQWLDGSAWPSHAHFSRRARKW